MLLIIRFLLVVILFIPAEDSFSQRKPVVRFDGLYQTVSEIDSVGNDTTYNFLRFYPDGKVLSVTSRGNAHDLKKWFHLKTKNPSVGMYEIKANRIYFSTTSNEGTVVYDGEIHDQYYLTLTIKSLINGYNHQEKYYFIKVIGLK